MGGQRTRAFNGFSERLCLTLEGILNHGANHSGKARSCDVFHYDLTAIAKMS